MAKKKIDPRYNCLDRKDIPSEKMELVHRHREFTFEASEPFSYETSEKMFSEFAKSIGCELTKFQKVDFTASPAITTNSLVLRDSRGTYFIRINEAENIGHTTWRLTFADKGSWIILCRILGVEYGE